MNIFDKTVVAFPHLQSLKSVLLPYEKKRSKFNCVNTPTPPNRVSSVGSCVIFLSFVFPSPLPSTHRVIEFGVCVCVSTCDVRLCYANVKHTNLKLCEKFSMLNNPEKKTRKWLVPAEITYGKIYKAIRIECRMDWYNGVENSTWTENIPFCLFPQPRYSNRSCFDCILQIDERVYTIHPHIILGCPTLNTVFHGADCADTQLSELREIGEEIRYLYCIMCIHLHSFCLSENWMVFIGIVSVLYVHNVHAAQPSEPLYIYTL